MFNIRFIPKNMLNLQEKGHSRVLRSVSLMFVSIAVFQRLHSLRGFSLILMRI